MSVIHTTTFCFFVAAITACASAPRDPAPAAPQQSSAAPAPPPATPSRADTPPASATEVLARSRAGFDACFAKIHAAHAEVHHTPVEITFDVDDAGRPSTVDLVYRRRMDDAAKECMRSAAFAVQFPPSLRGKQTGTIELGSAQ